METGGLSLDFFEGGVAIASFFLSTNSWLSFKPSWFHSRDLCRQRTRVTVEYVRPETAEKYTSIETTARQTFLITEVVLVNAPRNEKPFRLMVPPARSPSPQ